MADIISFEKGKEKKNAMNPNDLSGLLKRANLICKERLDFPSDKLAVVKKGQLKGIFERKISQEIFSRKLIGSDVFLCGIYVSGLLEELVLEKPESWWAIDYVGVDDPLLLRKGGDTCFIICGVFTERASRRLMNISYYQEMGAQFYYRFYGVSNKEIGYHMSNQFETMTTIVKSCIHDF